MPTAIEIWSASSLLNKELFHAEFAEYAENEEMCQARLFIFYGILIYIGNDVLQKRIEVDDMIGHGRIT